MAWPSDGSYTAWSTCCKATTQASKITAVNSWYFLDLSLLPAAFWSSVRSDGADIRCTEEDGETAIYHRLIFIDTSISKGLIAIAQPHGASGASVDIESRVYSGNAGASTTSNTAAFPSTLEGLWMLQEAPTSSAAVLDYTGNGRNSDTIGGSMTSGDLLTRSDGPHSALKCIDMDSNDYIRVPSTIFDDCETAGAYTFFGWVRPSLDAAAYGIFGSAGSQLYVRFETGSGWYTLEAHQRNSANSAFFVATSTSDNMAKNVWQMVHAVYNGSTLKTYVNGVEKASVSATSLRSATLNFYIGFDSVTYLRGRVCEFGMYSTALSADQIATLYANETDAGFWVTAEVEGDVGADVTGTAAAAMNISGAASGARGVAGSAAAGMDVAASVSGFRGVLGTAGAALSVAASATGLRGVYGTAAALVDLVASALGLRGVLGTAAAEVTITGFATDATTEKIGTVAADLVVSARAVGYVGALGPADGRALQPFLTGAAATGAPARDVEGSTGGFRSGARFRSMEWDSADPLIGVSILDVSGANGQGVGSLTAASAGSVTWTPPGGTVGTVVSLAAGAEIVAPGANSGAWLRLRRLSQTGMSAPLSGTHAVQCIDLYNNLFPDVATEDAVAGLVTERALMLLNTAGAVINFRAWVGDCDGDIEIALETPTDGELLGAGLSWSTGSTAETGPSISLVGDGVEIGLHLRRTVAAATAPSPSQAWDVRYQFSDGVATYESAVRGRYRIEREDYVKDGIWIGIGQDPDFDAAPDETWTTTPHTTSLGLTLPATVHAARRAMNKWGMWGIPTEVMVYHLDAEGEATRRPPSGPHDVSVMQTAANLPTVAATYEADTDGSDRAMIWAIWLATDGTEPDGSGDPDGYGLVQHNAAIDDLAWTSTGDGLMDGTPVKALVRLRRLDATGAEHSPDVIQLSDSGAGTLKFDEEITGWDTSGYARIWTRFGRLLEVVHYSDLVVASGQTTMTVDQRGLMGTSATATNPNYLVAPVIAVDSENTDTATWEISAVAPGRPSGALLFGERGSQAQAPVTGPDGVTPQMLDAGENVHLLLGEGWASLYVDAVLVWRCLLHGQHGEMNGLYVPSEWTMQTGAISGAASGPGVVDVVDSNTVYLVVNGVRRVLIDLAAMEITAASWDEDINLEQKAEQDGALDQFGATLLLAWDPEREDYRPYFQVTAAGAVNVATGIVETMTSAEVEALWQP